ncbi:TPA: hypothetical protein U1B53_001367 [Streptococcus suis]|nr:DUF6198 family protein [Streptococcus suis]NQM13058.1 hypothetical protein [Streptococcus suis]NQP32899.1 hypothetical protein [Streptococcus suis]NQP35923.1 hypothetical protein [Streptococcus suis]HEM3561208.1 hypothetical protein [Streptococcus suis]
MKFVKFIVAINIMAVAVVMSKSSLLGTSPIAAIPNVVSESFGASIGINTTVFLAILVLIQIIVAKPDSIKDLIPYVVQLIPGTCFGIFISFYDRLLTPVLTTQVYPIQLIILIISVFVLALGVLMEVQAGTVVMPGEGLPKTIALASGRSFHQVKLYCDSAMVIVALMLSFLFGNPFLGIREGTIIAMIFTGPVISFLQKHIDKYKK